MFQGIPTRFAPEIRRLLEVQPRLQVPRTHAAEINAGDVLRLGRANSNATPCFLLWGDSHAHMYADLFDDLAAEHGISGHVIWAAGRRGAVVAPSDAHEDRERIAGVLKFLDERQIRFVFLINRWSQRLGDSSTVAANGEETWLQHELRDRVLTEP